jgi:glycosyltransferase involved in cell wall biosynthesis
MHPILTIAIPTYNRREELLRTVAALIPGLNGKVRVVILDNHSDYVVKDAVCGAFDAEITAGFSFYRNPANLGCGPNVLRCFETAETEWVWILGDDDFPLPDAIATVLEAIAEYPEALSINFTSNILNDNGYARSGGTVAETLSELAGGLDCFSNLLFVSTNVYRVAAMRRQLRIGYLQLQSWGPHVSMLLSALQDQSGPVVLHPARVVNWKPQEPGKSWDYETVGPQLPEIFSVIADAGVRGKFREKNEMAHRRWLMSSCNVVSNLRKLAELTPSKPHVCTYVSRLYHELYSELAYSDKNLFFSAWKASTILPLLMLARVLSPLLEWRRVAMHGGARNWAWVSAPRNWARGNQDRL